MFVCRFMIVALVFVTGFVAFSDELGAQDRNAVVAEVDGEIVTATDLDEAWHQNDPSGRFQILQQLYETRRRALDVVIGDRLIEREADNRRLTRDQLLELELPPRIPPVSDEDVSLIYERNKDRFDGRSEEEMRPDLRAMIEAQMPLQALHAYMNELRTGANDIVVLLDPPRQNVEVLPDDAVSGPMDAPIQIVEFSDFDCPYCQRATDTLAELKEAFGNQIRFVYKDFPLPSHPNAFKAAEAGRCAKDQGKFWELHDKMFASQGALDPDSLKLYAAELGLDAAAFSLCLDEGRHAGRVQRDMAIGASYGVSSTPTLFVNGRLVAGAMPLGFFEELIREELAIINRR